MIQDYDISIVVQGPILAQSAFNVTDEITQLVCARLKKLMPRSELILSTWKDSNVENILYDQCIFNVDPGATWFNYKNYTLLNNCNRLILSTQAGVRAAKRPYIFKIRSDLFLLSKSFLKYFTEFPNYDESYKFVKNRIIAFSLDTIKSHRTPTFNMERPYHISDWAYFGYKEDIKNLFDIPLVKEPEFSQWFLNHFKPFLDMEPHRLWKMPPEQYITVSFLKKFFPIQFEHTNDISNNNIELSAKMLTNNFLVLDQTQFFLISLKYFKLQLLFPFLLNKTAIFFHTWLNDYHKYCYVPKNFKYFKERFSIFWRRNIYLISNKILRILNFKFQLVNKLAAYIIKILT